jgi:hypothetical protein
MKAWEEAVMQCCKALLGWGSQEITNAQIINSNQYSEGFRLRDIQLCCSKRSCWSSVSLLRAANNRVFLICTAGMLIFCRVIQSLGNAMNMWHWVCEAPSGGHSISPELAFLPVFLCQSLNTQLGTIWQANRWWMGGWMGGWMGVWIGRWMDGE